MSITRIRKLLAAILFISLFSVVPLEASSPFCADAGCAVARQFLKQICDYIVQNKSNVPTIYIGGYYMRTLVAGYQIFGTRRYLNTAVRYADGLLKKQNSRGYWLTGYGGIEVADTGSALGLFSALYPHVDKERQEKYVAAVERYFAALKKDGLIHPSGAFGYGWNTQPTPAARAHHLPLGSPNSERMTTMENDDYTIATALTGGEAFTWMYHVTGQDEYRQVAHKAISWILGTMNEGGVIPYAAGNEGIFLDRQDDPRNYFDLWRLNIYQASTYGGEGIIAFDLHCNQPEWKSELERRIKPQIEFLLLSQNFKGTWGTQRGPSLDCLGDMDPTRSPGVVNLLIWYYEHVRKDPRVVTAVRRFDRFLLNPEQARAFGILSSGATYVRKCENTDTVTSLTGYAVADILAPGVDARW
ncbi:MAG: hypothetical protein ACRD2B_15785 [Terriglobia bacterium]